MGQTNGQTGGWIGKTHIVAYRDTEQPCKIIVFTASMK